MNLVVARHLPMLAACATARARDGGMQRHLHDPFVVQRVLGHATAPSRSYGCGRRGQLQK